MTVKTCAHFLPQCLPFNAASIHDNMRYSFPLLAVLYFPSHTRLISQIDWVEDHEARAWAKFSILSLFWPSSLPSRSPIILLHNERGLIERLVAVVATRVQPL